MNDFRYFKQLKLPTTALEINKRRDTCQDLIVLFFSSVLGFFSFAFHTCTMHTIKWRGGSWGGGERVKQWVQRTFGDVHMPSLTDERMGEQWP